MPWRRSALLSLALLVATVALQTVSAQAAGFEWQTATPESEGLSTAKLDALKAGLAAHHTTGLLVVRNDKVVYEWYGPGYSATTKHYAASMAKALVGGMAVAVALSDGRLSLDDLAAKYVPAWQHDPVKSRITLRELGSHTSGLSDADGPANANTTYPGWSGDFWKRLPPTHDPFTISRDLVPILFPPGTAVQYSNPGMAMLSYVVTAALKNAPQKDLRTLLRDRVMRPIGVKDADWDVGYDQTFTVDGLPLVATWGGADYTARAVARVARLMLRGGDWQGRQILSRAAVRAVITAGNTPGDTAIGWGTNRDGAVKVLPRDIFYGAGAEHQVVLVVPGLNLIVVRNGGDLDPKLDYDEAITKFFFAPCLEAVQP